MEEQRLLTFNVFREQLMNFALAYHKSERKDIANDSSEWATDFFKETPAPELLSQVAALTKENERLKGGSIENPDHHIKVLKEQISRMEDEYEALTEQVEKSKAHFIAVTTDYQKQVNDLIEERADRIAELEKLKADKDAWIEETVSREKELSRLREERKDYRDCIQKHIDELKRTNVFHANQGIINYFQSLLDKFNDSKT